MLVSIAVITYNHQNYIRQALDSILMQSVNFEYEIVIGDDCSQDNTPQILEEYYQKYPSVIRLINREKNIGATKNFQDVLFKCSGKYIAILEGDDYWTDKNKLQYQIDFLEKNKTYSGVTHKYKKKDQYNNYIYERQKSGKYSKIDFSLGKLPGQTGTICFRNFLHDGKDSYNIIKDASNIVGDRTLILLMLLHGDIYCLDNYMSVYRVNSTATSWSSVDAKKNLCEDYMKYYCALSAYARKAWNTKQSLFWPKGKCVFNAFKWYKKSKSDIDRIILKKVFKLYDESYIKLLFCIGCQYLKSFLIKIRNLRKG